MNKTRVLITGAGGFLAGYLIKKITMDQRYELIALTSDPIKLRGRFVDSKLTIVDVKHFRSGELTFAGIDVLIHCAFAIVSDEQQLQASLDFTELVFEQAKISKIANIINTSSKSVYGDEHKNLVQETSTVRPRTLYGMAKYKAELLLEQTFKDNNTNYTNIRLASLIGPEFCIRVINKFIAMGIEQGVINIIGGEQKFSYLDVKDASDAIVRMFDFDAKWRHIYNLGHLKIYNIMEIAKIIQKIAVERYGIKIDLNIENTMVNDQTVMDCSAFCQDFNWRPRLSIHDSVIDIFQYYLRKELPI